MLNAIVVIILVISALGVWSSDNLTALKISYTILDITVALIALEAKP